MKEKCSILERIIISITNKKESSLPFFNQQDETGQNGSKAKSWFKFKFSNVKPLSHGFFEIWAVSKPLQKTESIGKFNVDIQGNAINEAGIPIENNVFASRLKEDEITNFFITIEPLADTDPASSEIKFVEGDLNDGSSLLQFKAVKIFQATGQYLLATPTNGPNSDETSGLWFLALSENGTTQFPMLELPTEGMGFVYEGWVENNGKILSIGKFPRGDFGDLSNKYSAEEETPYSFPGEDFLNNPPEGVTFPLNLADSKSKVFITLEPDIAGVDPTGEKPFQLSFLRADIPGIAKPGENYEMVLNILDFPVVTAKSEDKL